MNSQRGLDVLAWPAASPDLYPIEHIWRIICRQLDREVPAANFEVLRAQVWQNIRHTTINNLIDSMQGV